MYQVEGQGEPKNTFVQVKASAVGKNNAKIKDVPLPYSALNWAKGSAKNPKKFQTIPPTK